MRIAIPAFLLALSLSTFPLAAARADMAVLAPTELGITGQVEGSRLVYRITNGTREGIEIAQPHIVILERGMRLPLNITGMTVDGGTHSLTGPITLAPGQTVTLTLTLEAMRHGDIELRFSRGNVNTHRMAV